MSGKYIIALDQGTTSSRAILYDSDRRTIAVEQKEFKQHYPKPGWVEHDPEEIWQTQLQVLQALIDNNDVAASEIICLGITNQRETTVMWERATGKPVYNAIVWQDKRTSKYCDKMVDEGHQPLIVEKTGLLIDSYFSATKARWMADNVDGVKEKIKRGEVCFGTVDTWLIWKMTEGKEFVTDVSNASRTMLYNIHNLKWDDELIKLFELESSILPEVKANADLFGHWNYDGHQIPITGVAGDQQAALFGQSCFTRGMAKNTYGTGCFMLMNTGTECQVSDNGLVSTIAYKIGDEVKYALEGSIFVAGSAIQWLRDGLQIINDAAETEAMALRVKQEHEVFFVPALTGLGAPHWDMFARGAFYGLTRDTGRDHFAKAALDSIAYQTRDVLEAMQKDSGIDLQALKVDGGAVANNYLMQFQADILGVDVERPENIESTALGAACLAGLHTDLWDLKALEASQKIDQVFKPELDKTKREALFQRWQDAVKRSMNWIDKNE